MVQVRANEAVISLLGPLMDEDELYRLAASKFDPEEIRRRKQAGGPRYTTAEVLGRLRSLETP